MLFETRRVYFLVLFFSLSEAFITRHFKANEELSNKLLMHTLLESIRVRSNIRCAILCDNRCNCFNFNTLSGMCRLYSSCDLSDTTTSEAGWTYYTKLTKLTPQLVDIRLVGGLRTGEGRVEVFYNNTWGTICNWGHNAAKVACRMLGYSGTIMGASSGYPMRIGPIWMEDVWCEGHETSLEQCSFNGYGVRYCDNMEAAGVFCFLSL